MKKIPFHMHPFHFSSLFPICMYTYYERELLLNVFRTKEGKYYFLQKKNKKLNNHLFKESHFKI